MRKLRLRGVVSPAQDHTAAELLGLGSKLVLFPGQGSSLTWTLALGLGIWGGNRGWRRELPHPQTEPLGISPCPSAWGKREETMLWGLESAGPISHWAGALPSPPHSGLPRDPGLVELPQNSACHHPWAQTGKWGGGTCPPASAQHPLPALVWPHTDLRALGPSGERPRSGVVSAGEESTHGGGNPAMSQTCSWPQGWRGDIRVLGSQLWFQPHLHH